jgi:hypothetical protein
MQVQAGEKDKAEDAAALAMSLVTVKLLQYVA